MTGPREIIEDGLLTAARAARHGAAALIGIRVARALHGRWNRLSFADRERLAPLAGEVKDRALDLRGSADPRGADLSLREANTRLADAIVESAEANPEVSDAEVGRLREELSRELERLAGAEIRASRGPGAQAGVDTAAKHRG